MGFGGNEATIDVDKIEHSEGTLDLMTNREQVDVRAKEVQVGDAVCGLRVDDTKDYSVAVEGIGWISCLYLQTMLDNGAIVTREVVKEPLTAEPMEISFGSFNLCGEFILSCKNESFSLQNSMMNHFAGKRFREVVEGKGQMFEYTLDPPGANGYRAMRPPLDARIVKGRLDATLLPSTAKRIRMTIEVIEEGK